MSETLDRREAGGTSYLTGGEGPPVLFLHGIPGSAHTWEGVATRLADRHRVVVPDLRGFGHSDPPEADYYMADQARAIADLLASLDIDSFALVAHDFGGPVGLTLMRHYPDLAVDRLVLSSTNTFTDTYVPPPLRTASIPILNTVVFWLMVGNRFGHRMLYRSAVRDKERFPWNRYRRHLTRSGMAMTRRIFQRSLADLDANYGHVERMLPEISVPTLVLWGEGDPFFSTDVAERTRAAIPDADLLVFERTGHFVPEERETDVAAAISEFLDLR